MFCAAAIVVLFAPAARADQYDKLTYLTFSGPVQIPGMVLPAGTYEFKLADPDSGRRVVSVSDKDSKKFYKLLLTLPNERMKPADKRTVMFSERPTGDQPAVQVWFYLGETYGYEFVYPKDQAIKIAKASHTSVAAMADNSSSDVKSLENAKIVHIDENGNSSDDNASKSSATPESTIAQNNTPEPSANRTGNASPAPVAASGSANTSPAPTGTSMRRRELPGTASPIEFYGLLSSLSLAGAFGARQLRKRLAERA